jgi:valyl-tRNA synthetase
MDEMGTDALRFTLLVGSTPGNDMNLSLAKVKANRNFANKLWNGSRLVLSSISKVPKEPQEKPDWTLADAFIWARTEGLIRDVDRLFKSFQYGEAGRHIFDFFWSEFADWYLEIAKLQLLEGGDRAFYTVDLMIRILDFVLRLLHPFTPFITEELYHHLKQASRSHSSQLIPEDGSWADALIIAPWPMVGDLVGWEESAIDDFSKLQDIIRSVRNFRTEKNINPGQKLSAVIISGDSTEVLSRERKSLAFLAKLDDENIRIVDKLDQKPQDHVGIVTGNIEIYLPFADLINIEEERKRLVNEFTEVTGQVDRLEKLLESPFSEKAPEEIVQKEKQKLETYLETARKIEKQIQELTQ